ncbi:MAG: hypothetical protein GXY33_20490, partial [Phycisphaerae bacterium]|nr:hypothetical protein [Phycisphaerae bacterium]
GSGPAAWLIREVLGVKPRRPGFAEVAIEPHCGDLAWARGTVPTPMGTISISWSKGSDGGLRVETDVPVGVGEARVWMEGLKSGHVDGSAVPLALDESGCKVLKVASAGRHMVELA